MSVHKFLIENYDFRLEVYTLVVLKYIYILLSLDFIFSMFGFMHKKLIVGFEIRYSLSILKLRLYLANKNWI